MWRGNHHDHSRCLFAGQCRNRPNRFNSPRTTLSASLARRNGMGEAKAPKFLTISASNICKMQRAKQGQWGGRGIGPQWINNTEWIKGWKDGQGAGRENKTTINEKHGKNQAVKGQAGRGGEGGEKNKTITNGKHRVNQWMQEMGEGGGRTESIKRAGRARKAGKPPKKGLSKSQEHKKQKTLNTRKRWTPNPTQGIVLQGVSFAGTVRASSLRPSGQQRAFMPPYWGSRRIHFRSPWAIF